MDAPALATYTGGMGDTDQLDGLIGYHLRRASSMLMAKLAERLATLDLRPTEASVLVVLHGRPGATQSDIGRQLSIKRANMAPLVAGLSARGLIERADPVGRSHPLRLSAAGAALAAAASVQMAEHDAHFFGALDEDERERLRGFFADLWRDRSGPPASG